MTNQDLYIILKSHVGEFFRVAERQDGSIALIRSDSGIVLMSADKPGSEWCPVCKTYHVNVGEKTDAGALTRPCPSLAADDPRNIAANFPGRNAR